MLHDLLISIIFILSSLCISSIKLIIIYIKLMIISKV